MDSLQQFYLFSSIGIIYSMNNNYSSSFIFELELLDSLKK